MSDMNDLIKRFSAGSGSAAKPEKSNPAPTPPPTAKPAAAKSRPAAKKAAPAKPAPKEEKWELPADIRPSDDPETLVPAPVPAEVRTSAEKEPQPFKPLRTPKPTPRRKDPTPVCADPKPAGTHPAIKPPLRGGHVGRVLSLQEIPKDELPPRLTRWFTSLLTGVPYTPSKTGVIFYLQPEDEDDSSRVYRVTAYGNLGLSNHMRLCVQGHSESSGNLVAHQILRDASVDPEHPDWAPVRDRRSRSTLSLWLTIIGIGLLAWLLLSELLLPLIAWLIAYGGEILTWVIVIVILVAIFGGFGRGRRRWF